MRMTRFRMSVSRTLTVACLAVLLPALTAGAQAPGPSLPDLRSQGLVAPGDTVYVTDGRGQRTKGRLTELSATGLTLAARGGARDFQSVDIVRIERGDSLENGMLIGLAAGIGATVAFCKADTDSEACPYIVAYFGLPAMGGGAILGALIDASVRKTLYLAAGERRLSRVTFSPAWSRTSKGVLVGWAF